MSTRSPAKPRASQRTSQQQSSEPRESTEPSPTNESSTDGAQLTGDRIVSTTTVVREQLTSSGTVGGGASVRLSSPMPSATASKQVKSTPLASRVGFASQPHTPARSPSPVRISRNEEKEEIAHLNTRLATYIDYVRNKETAADNLSRKLSSFSESHEEEIASVKKLYEREIDGLRKALDNTANERSKLQVDNKKLLAEHAEMSDTMNRRDKQISTLEKRVETLESDLAVVRTDANKYASLRPDHDKLLKQLETLKKQLESEAQLRTQLENRMQTLREEHDLKEKIFKEEKEKIQKRCAMVEKEITVASKAEFESRLAQELALAREQSDEAMTQFQAALENTFQSKLDHLRKLSDKSNTDAVSTREEIISIRKRFNALSGELAQAQSEANLLRKRNDQLESSLEQQRKDYEAQIAHYKEEIQALHFDVQSKFEDYNELMLIKIRLDQEILAYRKLLECEESRCHLSPCEMAASPFVTTSSGSRALKRRRTNADSSFDGAAETHLHSRSTYTMQKEQCGAIEFLDVDIEGRFLRLHNSGEKEVALGGWTLKLKVDEKEELTYKFSRQLNFKAGANFTLWSGDSGVKHDPSAGEILMKGLILTRGIKVRSVLLDEKNHEMASCVLNADVSGSSKTFSKRDEGRNASEKCSLM